MVLEKKEYIPEEYKEVYEDEIDLKELFLVLWRNKIKISLIAVICMILAFGLGQMKSAKSKKSTVILEYTYPGIEQGKSPNGNTLGLTYNPFKNIFMIKDIFHKMPELEKSGISQDNLLNAIKITPVLPENLEKGKVYYPNKFLYSLKITDSSEKDEEILRNFVEVQRDYFKRNYKLNSHLPLLNPNDSSSYDYKDIVYVVGTSLNSAITSAQNLSSEMVITEDKIEVQNILKELQILKTINLVKIQNIIDDFNLTKNPNELMLTYRHDIEVLERQKEKIAGKIAQLEEMVKNYKPAEKNIVIMNSGNSESIKTNDENYYTEFLRQLSEEKIKLSDTNAEIKYIKEKMKKEIKKDADIEIKVDKELESIITEINAKIEKINSLLLKNYNIKYSEIIKISEDVTTKSSSKTMIIALAGLIFGGFIGICYVLLGNFIFEEKKKSLTK